MAAVVLSPGDERVVGGGRLVGSLAEPGGDAPVELAGLPGGDRWDLTRLARDDTGTIRGPCSRSSRSAISRMTPLPDIRQLTDVLRCNLQQHC